MSVLHKETLMVALAIAAKHLKEQETELLGEDYRSMLRQNIEETLENLKQGEYVQLLD